MEPILNPATRYRLEVRGHVDIEWLRSLQGPVAISVEGAGQRKESGEDITVFAVTTDQAGIVGMVRTLHGLGVTIQQFQIVQAV